jgi:hypothetical protein
LVLLACGVEWFGRLCEGAVTVVTHLANIPPRRVTPLELMHFAERGTGRVVWDKVRRGKKLWRHVRDGWCVIVARCAWCAWVYTQVEEKRYFDSQEPAFHLVT